MQAPCWCTRTTEVSIVAPLRHDRRPVHPSSGPRRQPLAIEVHFDPNTYCAFDDPNLPLTEMTSQRWPDGTSALAGSNPEARADAITRVTQLLARELQ